MRCFFGLLFATSPIWAQTTNGTIVGSVRDSSGLAVSGAAIRLTQAGTGVVRSGVSSQRGDFTFPSLVAGEYAVLIAAAGFKSVEPNPVPLGANFAPFSVDPTQAGGRLRPSFLRPITGFNNIGINEWASSSNYHSLQVTASRRFAKSVEFGLAWTWSKAMGYNDGDTNEVSTLVSPRVWNYGLSSIDRTHVVNLNWLWTLPRTRSTMVRAVLNDWQLSGIASFISGAPVGIGLSTVTTYDISGTPNLAPRVDVLSNPVLPKAERTFERNFRTDVFRLPAQGAIGTAQNPLLRGPGVNNFDISLFKSFPIHERVRAQFRCEMYNAFNHTQFSSFDTAARFDVATGAQVNTRLGEFSAARRPRIMQMALRLTF